VVYRGLAQHERTVAATVPSIVNCIVPVAVVGLNASR
jgi:hypothetical protein